MDGEIRMLTIGTFARASRLSPKALRLYDEANARGGPDNVSCVVADVVEVVA